MVCSFAGLAARRLRVVVMLRGKATTGRRHCRDRLRLDESIAALPIRALWG
jgi:hypothetical protein